MRKYLFTLTLLLTTSFTFAQTVKFGVKTGLNLAKQVLSNTSVSLYSNNLTAFNLGGIVDIGFTDFAIQPGVFFTTKGQQYRVQYADQQGNVVGSGADRYVLIYLEVPVNLLYKANIADNIKIHAGGGPYFGYGLSARATIKGVEYQGSFSRDASYDLVYKNPDYGVNFLAGLLLQDRYILDIQYGLGLANLTYGAAKLQNRVLSVSVGYMF